MLISDASEVVPGFYIYLALKSRFPDRFRVRFFYRRIKHDTFNKREPSVAIPLEIEPVREDWKLVEGPFKTRRQAALRIK